MLTIKINNTTLDCWDGAYPVWIHIEQDSDRISLHHNEALAVRDALDSLIKHAYNDLKSVNKQTEVKLGG